MATTKGDRLASPRVYLSWRDYRANFQDGREVKSMGPVALTNFEVLRIRLQHLQEQLDRVTHDLNVAEKQLKKARKALKGV